MWRGRGRIYRMKKCATKNKKCKSEPHTWICQLGKGCIRRRFAAAVGLVAACVHHLGQFWGWRDGIGCKK